MAKLPIILRKGFVDWLSDTHKKGWPRQGGMDIRKLTFVHFCTGGDVVARHEKKQLFAPITVGQFVEAYVRAAKSPGLIY